MMLLTESRDWYIIYRSENKSRIFTILRARLQFNENHYPSWHLRFQVWKKAGTFTKKASSQKVTIGDIIT